MSDQPTSPTGQQAGQPAAPAQGTQAPQNPALNEDQLVDKLFSKLQSRADKYLNERVRKAFGDETQEKQPAQAAANAPTSQEDDAETQWARNIEKVFNTTLEPSDPEAALVLEGQTPAEYRKNVIEALKLKKARLAQAPAQGAPPAAPTTPTTTGGTGAPAPKPDLMKKYQAEIAQPGLTKDQRLNIRVKYRREGLDI